MLLKNQWFNLYLRWFTMDNKATEVDLSHCSHCQCKDLLRQAQLPSIYCNTCTHINVTWQNDQKSILKHFVAWILIICELSPKYLPQAIMYLYAPLHAIKASPLKVMTEPLISLFTHFPSFSFVSGVRLVSSQSIVSIAQMLQKLSAHHWH